MTSARPTLMPAVVLRELRAAARRRGTYWMRALVVAVALTALLLRIGTGRVAQILMAGGPGTLPGGEIFALLHTVLSITLLLAAPAFAADCIARERREGTLGLLGLTPLRPVEIVLGKVAVQAVRLVSLWLACVPVLALPVLMGGVSRVDFQYALGIEFMILVGGLAAGLVATSLHTRWVHSAAWAFAGTLFGGQCLTLFAASLLRWGAFRQAPGIPTEHLTEVSPFLVSIFVWPMASGLTGFAGLFGSVPAWIRGTADVGLVCGVGIVIAVLFGSVRFAGRRVRWFLLPQPDSRIPPREPTRGRSSARAEALRRRWLATNPARWLCQTAGDRRGRWLWLGVVAAGWITFISLRYRISDLEVLTRFLPLTLAVPMALHAAASFRQEIEEGTLELLLVTPLEPGKLVWARVRQLWALYLPAVIANGLCMVFLPMDGGTSDGLFVVHWIGIISLLALPALGIRYAVRRLHPLAGFVWSLLTAGVLPLLMGGLLGMVACADGRGSQWKAFGWVLGFGGTQILLSATWGWLAARDLKTRQYMLRPFQRRPA